MNEAVLSDGRSGAASGGSVGLYLASSFFAFLAGNMFNYGMIIYSRYISRSDGFTGAVNLAAYVVPLCLSLYAGVVIDRVPRKHLLLLFQSLWLLTALALAVTTAISVGHVTGRGFVLGIALVNGIAFTFLAPTRFAYVADLAPAESLGKLTILVNVLLIVGFGLAPVLVGQVRQHWDWPHLFGFIVVLFIVSQLLLSLTRPTSIDSRSSADARLSVREGLKRLREDGLLLQLMHATGITFFALGPIQILVPEFARGVLSLSEGGRGGLMAMLGLGLLVGGVLALFAGRTKRRGVVILATQAATGVAIYCLSRSSGFASAGGSLLAAGLCGGMAGSIIPASIQTNVAPELRGRMMSYYSLVSLVAPAIAGAVFGLLADRVGLVPTLQLTSGVLLLTSLIGSVGFDRLRAYT